MNGIGGKTSLDPGCGTGIFDPDITVFIVKRNAIFNETVVKNGAAVKTLTCHAGTERDDPALHRVFAGSVADNVAAGTVELIFITEKQTVFNDGIGDVVNGNTAAAEVSDTIFNGTFVRIAHVDAAESGTCSHHAGSGIISAENQSADVEIFQFAASDPQGIPSEN